MTPTHDRSAAAIAALAKEGIQAHYDQGRDKLMIGLPLGPDLCLIPQPASFAFGRWHFDTDKFSFSDGWRRAISRALNASPSA